MEAELATLPEFDLIGMDTVTSPVYRTRWFAQRILFLNLLLIFVMANTARDAITELCFEIDALNRLPSGRLWK